MQLVLTLNFLVFIKTSYTLENDFPYVDIRYHPNFGYLPNEQCGYSSDENRIIGGKTATLGQYPWNARLGYKVENCLDPVDFKCGGALITNRHIVTAAHCVAELPKTYCKSKDSYGSLKLSIIRLGEFNVNTNPDCDEDDVCADPVKDVGLKKIRVHPGYVKLEQINDIALITLKNPVSFTDWISPLCLISGENVYKNYINEVGIVTGWGIKNLITKKRSSKLEYLRVPIRSPNICSIIFKKLIISGRSQICAGGVKGKDSCSGDSGGPLIVIQDTENGPRYGLLGIVSFGYKTCAYRPFPAIYTNVMFYGPWILNQIVE